MTLTDTDLCDALAPLRGDEPTDTEVAAVLAAAATSPASGPRRRRRLALAAGAAGVAVTVAVAALPSAPVERAGEPVTARSILRAAAAVAADQPPTAFTGYRYTEWIDHWRWTGPVTVEIEQRLETWVDREWRGRVEAQPPRVIEGGERAERYATDSGTYQYGDSRRPDLRELPTEPTALRDALVDNIRSENWAPGLPTPDELHYYLLRKTVFLLGDATTTPPLRAALFGVLALMPGVEPAPDARDALGRSGDAVRIPTRRADGAITVIFDSDTSQMLYWSENGSGGGTPDQGHTIVRAGQVEAVGDRP